MMSISQIQDSLSIGAVYVVTALMSLLAIEVGWRLGKYRQKQNKIREEGGIGVIVGATLGLLAFILAFIIGIGLDRFDERRLLVIDEANAITTAWLRAGLLPEPMGSESRALLQEYVDRRLETVDPEQLYAALERSEAIQAELWRQAMAAAETDHADMATFYIESLNELINIHTGLMASVAGSRIPSVVWTSLYFISMLSMILTGLQFSSDKRRNWPGVILLMLVYAAVVTLIVDLDRPADGLFSVSRQALFDLQDKLRLISP